MATAPVSIAPSLTPHTLGMLADTLEQGHLSEQALLLRKLLPFVEDLVDKCFVPLLGIPKQANFADKIRQLTEEFEPCRIFMNLQIFSVLANQNFSGFYEQVFLDTLGPLLLTAREMEMGPEFISAAVRDYIQILRALQIHADISAQNAPVVSVDQVRRIVELFHAATRFDYALTAILLILERSLPTPDFSDRGTLLIACKEALLDFGQAISRAFFHAQIQRALQNLETPYIEIKVAETGIHLKRLPTDKRSEEAATQTSRRHAELSWLARHQDLADQYGGQWIVLEKDDLIANDADYRKARAIATQRGIKRPFIIFVPPKEAGAFMGI